MGSLGAGGAGLALGDILRLRALGASKGKIAGDTAVIQIWLGGGPSQFETFDPQRWARGESWPLQSHSDQVARRAPLREAAADGRACSNKTAIIRSFTHPYDDHFGVTRVVLCRRREPDDRVPLSVAGRHRLPLSRPATRSMPPYVLLCEDIVNHHHLFSVMGSGYLGAGHGPFTIMQDGYQPNFQHDRLRDATGNLELANDIDVDRVDDRKSLTGHS